MQWHELIFPANRRQRILRHVIFWSVWLVYLSFIKWYDREPDFSPIRLFPFIGMNEILKEICLLLLQAVNCYTFIYFLLPVFLLRSKWIKLFTGVSALCIFTLIASYLLHWKLFPDIDLYFGKSFTPNNILAWTSIYNGLLNSPKIVASAAIIKLLQYWQQKQKEKEEMESLKMITELQLLKAQIRPVFLFNALNNIYAYSLARSPRAPEMLMKLADLLSYLLYECDNPFVPLEKEIEMMRGYISLENIRHSESIEIEFIETGDSADKKIPPFLLLPFIENSFRQCKNMMEQSWINLEIRIEEDAFSMKLINGMPPRQHGQADPDPYGFSSVKKRLSLLYPGKHELTVTLEQEMLLVLLKINLAYAVSGHEWNPPGALNTLAAEEQTNLYVEP